jgi:DNA repair protein RadC
MSKSKAAQGEPAASTSAKRAKTTASKRAKAVAPTDEERIRAAVAPYLSLRRLQHLVAYKPDELQHALLTDDPPLEVQAMLHVLAALLRPAPREPITRVADVAALLVAEMSNLAQEHVRVVCLDTKRHIQTIHTVYQGTLNGTSVRLSELFREAFRRNSAAIILVHNHPSGDLTPSQDDLLITRQISTAGRLLNIPVLDHIIIGRGRWLSMGGEYPLFDESPAQLYE